MKYIHAFIIGIALLFSCNQDKTKSIGFFERAKSHEDVYDGEYCAEVYYYNPRTGTQSSYTLIVAVNNNVLKRVNFPTGYLDEEEIGDVLFDGEGRTSFTNTKGYQYMVKIIGDDVGCFDNVPNAKQCKGITKKGNRCKIKTDAPSGYCFYHQK